MGKYRGVNGVELLVWSFLLGISGIRGSSDTSIFGRSVSESRRDIFVSFITAFVSEFDSPAGSLLDKGEERRLSTCSISFGVHTPADVEVILVGGVLWKPFECVVGKSIDCGVVGELDMR